MTGLQFTAEPGVPQTIIVRRFAAPPELVFRAYVDPDLLARWLGPRSLLTTIDRFEARDGGRWRITHRHPDGDTITFHGLFHGDPRPERIVRTYECENVPGPVYLDTVTLEADDGSTLLRQNTVFQTVEDRDFYLTAGALTGVRESVERLEALLDELIKQGET